MWRGEKIQLKVVEREYLPKYVEWLNDWEVSQFIMPGVPLPMNIEDETEWFENRRKASKENIVFAIVTLEGDRLIGNCGLHSIDYKNRSATFGIFIGDKNYLGKGFGTDATRALLRFAFEQLGLNRVDLWVYAFNPRALRAYEKAGFRRVGVKRQGLFRNGTFHDEFYMDVLRDEWEKTK